MQPLRLGLGDSFVELSGGDARAILRAQNRNASRIVLLDEVQTRRVRALIANRRVPVAERAAFLRDPSGWLSARVLTDVDAEFSPRVIGVEVWRARYAGAAMESRINWFDRKPEWDGAAGALEAPGGSEAGARGEEQDLEPRNVVPKIHDNDEELAFGSDAERTVNAPDMAFELEESRYRRMPLPHQREAIGWLLAHAERSVKPAGAGRKAQGGGFLLADDMGLGKSFSVLVFLAEWQARQRQPGGEPKKSAYNPLDSPFGSAPSLSLRTKAECNSCRAIKAVTGALPSAAMPLKTKLSPSERNNFRRAEVSQ
jgi:hypothetical protein